MCWKDFIFANKIFRVLFPVARFLKILQNVLKCFRILVKISYEMDIRRYFPIISIIFSLQDPQIIYLITSIIQKFLKENSSSVYNT